MRIHACAALAIVTLSLSPSSASAAAVQHGLLGGLQLFYRHSDKVVLPSSGAAYVDNTLVELDRPWGTGGFWTVPCQTLLPNTWYYAYIVNAGQVVKDSPFVPNNYSWLCSSVAPPTSDGHPQVALDGTDPFDGIAISTADALFIGSFRTDGNAAIVPFYRNGDEVTLVETVRSDFQLAWAGNAANKALPSPSLFVPFSASAAVLDVEIFNTDTVSHWFAFLDPNDTTIGAGGAKSVQLELAADADTACGIPSYGVQTHRTTVNLNAQHEFWAYTNPTRIGQTCGQEVGAYVQLRGYVEVLHSLTPGCVGAVNSLSSTIETPCCNPGIVGKLCTTGPIGMVCLQNGDCQAGNICCVGPPSLKAPCGPGLYGTCQ